MICADRKLDHDGAVADLEHALAIAPDWALARQLAASEDVRRRDWADFDREVDLIHQSVRNGQLRHSSLCLPGDVRNRLGDSSFVRVSMAAAAILAQPAQPHPPRSREKFVWDMSQLISGYAVSLLMAGLFEQHDKTVSRPSLSAPAATAAMRCRRAHAASDRFIDISALPDGDAAACIRREEIDILVTLNGYFECHRRDRRHGRYKDTAAKVAAAVDANFGGKLMARHHRCGLHGQGARCHGEQWLGSMSCSSVVHCAC